MLLDFQARNQLGAPHQGGEEFSKRGTNFLNYVQYFQNTSNTFFLWGQKFFYGGIRPLWLRACGLLYITKNKNILAYFIRILSS